VLHVTPPLALCWHPELQVMNAIFQPSQVAHVAGLAESVGGWRASGTGLEDWDLWLRLAIVPREDHVALVHLISCVTQEHADRIGALNRRIMRHQLALYEDVLGVS
jgi:hypothetical protein